MEYKINLKQIRELHNLSQNNIANILGINRTVYTKYENGYVIILILELMKYLNCLLINIKT